MADLTKENIKQLTKLCRIDCSEEEQEGILCDLQSILKYVEQLDEINTDGVAPCNQVIAGMCNVTRKDVIGESMPQKDFLDNAPAKFGGMVKVPPVIKQQ